MVPVSTTLPFLMSLSGSQLKTEYVKIHNNLNPLLVTYNRLTTVQNEGIDNTSEMCLSCSCVFVASFPGLPRS